jgi:hypothetical protein
MVSPHPLSERQQVPKTDSKITSKRMIATSDDQLYKQTEDMNIQAKTGNLSQPNSATESDTINCMYIIT